MCNFSNRSTLKWLKLTQNDQFHLIHNFPHILLPKWLRITSKWEILVKFQQKLQYLSEIFIEPLEQGSFFWTSWNESKECYAIIKSNKNLNISAESEPICTEPSEQGSFFEASWNETKECYAMIKTDKKLNISVESWPICTEPSVQGLFFQASRNESKEWYAMIKTDENLHISAESQLICTGNFFLNFSTFLNCFIPKWLKMTHNGKFCQEK